MRSRYLNHSGAFKPGTRLLWYVRAVANSTPVWNLRTRGPSRGLSVSAHAPGRPLNVHPFQPARNLCETQTRDLRVFASRIFSAPCFPNHETTIVPLAAPTRRLQISPSTFVFASSSPLRLCLFLLLPLRHCCLRY